MLGRLAIRPNRELGSEKGVRVALRLTFPDAAENEIKITVTLPVISGMRHLAEESGAFVLGYLL